MIEKIDFRILVVDFTNFDACLESIRELEKPLSSTALNRIAKIHANTSGVIKFMPISFMPDICFRAANEIVSIVQSETGIRLAKYKRHNYELS